LEVAYSPVVDLHLIAQIQSLVAGSRARVPVRFRSVAAERLTDRLFEGTSHAAIGILPVEDDIAKACILNERLFVALPTTHRLAQRHTVQAGQLGDDPVIWAFGAQDSIASKQLADLFRRAGYVPNVTREAQCIAEALGLVREGFGVAFVNASALQLHPEGLVIRPFSEAYLVVETGLLYLAEHRSEFLKEFVSLVTHQLRCDGPRASDQSPVS
jgi:DNA-binding transcriptional LysR family regulator